MELLVPLLVVCIVIAVAWVILNRIPIPADIKWLAYVILLIIALVALLNYLPLPHGRFL